MKFMRRFLSAMAMVCTALCLTVSASAVDLDDARFKDRTWDEIMAEFLEAHNTKPEQVTVGYYNTVTGEEHYLNPDQLMYGASVAKLPANMVYAERVSKGEMTMETKIRGVAYKTLQEKSLIISDNPSMSVMVQDLAGGSANYPQFRRTILPYIGLTEEEVDDSFLARNFFTPKQIMYCLKLLYGNQERFPGVEECLLKASPYDFFKQNQPPYSIAHKYGWYTDKGITYLNDCGIVYTDDPILLVMFTANPAVARSLLADYCSLMCDYTQYHRTLRYYSEAREQFDLDFNPTIEYLSVNTPQSISTEYPLWQYGLIGAGGFLLLIALIVMIRKKLAAFILILLAAVPICLGIIPTKLAMQATEDGTAEQLIAQFASAFTEDARGKEYLSGIDHVLAQPEGTDLQSRITAKAAESFRLVPGQAQRVGNSIAVPVTATKVDIAAVMQDIQAQWDPALYAYVENIDPKQMYDESGTFSVALIEQAQQQFFDALMAQWGKYLVTESATVYLTLTLDEFNPVWKIVTDRPFLDLVNYNET